MRADLLPRPLPPATPWVVGVLATVLVTAWLLAPVRAPIPLRIPGTDRPPELLVAAAGTPPASVSAAGLLTPGPGKPVDLPGEWPRFRGPRLDGASPDPTPLASNWPSGGPRRLWSIEVGEGYAGPAIANGRVYLMDYDREKQRAALRCLSLADGAELWSHSYPLPVKRNHGLTRTVPTLADGRVVAMGPKCHVICLDAATGRVRWKTPNASGWKMTHSSVIPFDIEDLRYYLYCAGAGVVAVDAMDGSVAWETAGWKINIATVPSPVVLDQSRVFFTGGYNAGCLLLEFKPANGRLAAREVFRHKAAVFGATQHSPVWFGGNLYGIRADGRLDCLSPDGAIRWTSDSGTLFGLGPLMIADGRIFAMADAGRITLAEATPEAFRPAGSTQAIPGGIEAWAPLALAGDRLIARDLTRMVCLHVGPE